MAQTVISSWRLPGRAGRAAGRRPTDLVVEAGRVRCGRRRVALADIRAIDLRTGVEQPLRLGAFIAANLCLATALGFLLPILGGYWGAKFYLGVALFTMLAFAALDDILRARAQTVFRLVASTEAGEVVLLATPEEAVARQARERIERELAGLPGGG